MMLTLHRRRACLHSAFESAKQIREFVLRLAHSPWFASMISWLSAERSHFQVLSPSDRLDVHPALDGLTLTLPLLAAGESG
jgi:hypothetical protein